MNTVITLRKWKGQQCVYKAVYLKRLENSKMTLLLKARRNTVNRNGALAWKGRSTLLNKRQGTPGAARAHGYNPKGLTPGPAPRNTSDPVLLACCHLLLIVMNFSVDKDSSQRWVWAGPRRLAAPPCPHPKLPPLGSHCQLLVCTEVLQGRKTNRILLKSKCQVT